MNADELIRAGIVLNCCGILDPLKKMAQGFGQNGMANPCGNMYGFMPPVPPVRPRGVFSDLPSFDD